MTDTGQGKGWTASQVLDVLEKYHKPVGQEWNWAYFEEQRIGTGWGPEAQQAMDAWAIHYWPSKKNVSVAYEVKVSRSDFHAEIRNPLKRRPALRLSNRFYFAAPEGLIKPEEIPPECGLMEICERPMGLVAKIKLNAPFRDIEPPTWNFVASLCRTIWKLEDRLREDKP